MCARASAHVRADSVGHCCFHIGVCQENSLSHLHWRTRRGFTHFEIRSPLRSPSIYSLLGSALQSPSTSYFWLICAAQSLSRVLHSSTLSVQGSFGLVFVSRSLSHETAVACVPRSCGHGLADLRPVVDESSGGAGCAGAEQPGEDTDTDWEHALNTMLGGPLGGPGPSRFPGLPAPLAF